MKKICQQWMRDEQFPYLIACVVFWVAMVLIRFPSPSFDDIFFTGTPINLLKTGVYTNPWLGPWNSTLESGKFFFQPPFYSYILAGWLWLTGIGTLQFLIFQAINGLVFSIAAGLLLKRLGVSRWVAFCVPVLFCFTLREQGFRPDWLALAFLATGLVLLLKPSFFRIFSGAMCLGASVLTLTVFISWAFGMGVPLFWWLWKHNTNAKSKDLLRLLIPVLLACVVCLVLFHLCISGEWHAFWKDYTYHASFRRPHLLEIPFRFAEHLFNYWSKVMIAPSFGLFLVAAIGIGINWTMLNLLSRVFLAGIGFASVFNLLLYPVGLIHYGWLAGWIVLLCALDWFPRASRWRWVFAGIAAGVLVTSQITNLVGTCFTESFSEKGYQEIRDYVKANPERRYAIDSVAAYYVFNYDLPRQVTDWGGQKPMPAYLPDSMAEKPADMTWIAQRAYMGQVLVDGKKDYPKAKVFGREFNSVPARPFEVELIP